MFFLTRFVDKNKGIRERFVDYIVLLRYLIENKGFTGKRSFSPSFGGGWGEVFHRSGGRRFLRRGAERGKKNCPVRGSL